MSENWKLVPPHDSQLLLTFKMKLHGHAVGVGSAINVILRADIAPIVGAVESRRVLLAARGADESDRNDPLPYDKRHQFPYDFMQVGQSANVLTRYE